MSSVCVEEEPRNETPRAHITVKRIVFASTKPKFPDTLTQMLRHVLQFVIWCKQEKMAKIEGITWFDMTDRWSILVRDSQTKVSMPIVMFDEYNGRTEEVPLWCIDDMLSDYMRRAYRITERLDDLMHGYNQTSPTFIRSFTSDDESKELRTFMPYSRTSAIVTLPSLLTHLYYEDPEEMPDKGAMAKISLMNILCASHPEISATFSIQSPRVYYSLKHHIQSNSNRMIMLSLAHACHYFLMADRQVIVLIFRIWVRMNEDERFEMYNYFGWLTTNELLLEYMQIACIIEDDRVCLNMVHKLMIKSQCPKAFKVNEVVNRWSLSPRVRQRSASITVMEHQDNNRQIPPPASNANSANQSSPRSAPSSSRGGDKPSPWTGIGPYARSLYTAIIRQSNNCLAVLYEDYEMFYELCRMSDLTLDHFDVELPHMTLKELFTQMGYKELSDDDANEPAISLHAEDEESIH